MSRLWFTSQAEQDLNDIFDHIARDKPIAAAKFVALIRKKCRTLASFPTMGTLRDDLAKSLRLFSVRNYVICFRPTDDGILVVRVLSGFRDIDSLF